MSPEVNKQSYIVNGLILYKLAFFSFNIFGMYMSICFLYLLLFYISFFMGRERRITIYISIVTEMIKKTLYQKTE